MMGERAESSSKSLRISSTALVAHPRERAPLVGREVYEEGEFLADGVDGGEHGLAVGVAERGADAVIWHRVHLS
jgi:hypothetical protein